MAAKLGRSELGFVHLHVHSSYSLLEGALTIARLAELAKKDRQPALALTDTDNMFGALEFSEKMAGAGIQPIVGCALGDRFRRPGQRAPAGADGRCVLPRLVLLAAREDGYRNLMRLCSRAYLETRATEPPHIKLAWLDGETDGLIALTGGPGGPLDAAIVGGQNALAPSRCDELQRLFGDRLYIELQRHGMPDERDVEPALIDLAYRQGIPLVATNEPFFATREDYEAHDALLCIAEGRLHRRGRPPPADRRASLQDPRRNGGAVRRSAGGAGRDRRDRRALRLPAADAQADPAALHRRPTTTEAGRRGRRIARQAPRPGSSAGLPPRRRAGHTARTISERLAYELGVIERMKYPGYFLIVSDFIQWAKAQGIPVGPGRGSGAGSLVAWALTITDLDPIRFGLLFERFLNPERVSMPDFDIDFCQDRRDEVIRYVQQRYGRDRVAQIITFGTLQARAVLRDVGRVLQMPYGQVDSSASWCRRTRPAPVTLETRHRRRAAAAGRARSRADRRGAPSRSRRSSKA